MVEAAKRVLRFAQNIERITLETDEEKLSAVLYQIIIIGEATKRLSPQFREQYPEIPWKQIAGMRDVITHHYEGVDTNVVWNVIQNNLPPLIGALEPLLPPP
ncbi:MAG TPA: DUF86 domain-containing protein [Crinalium sp.]